MLTVAAAVLAGCACMSNSSEATEQIQDGSSAHPYLKTVSISVCQTKIVYIPVNLAAFEFVQNGDGYCIDYGVGQFKHQIDGRLAAENGRIPTWPTSETALDTEHITINPIRLDSNGNFGFAITLNSSGGTECVVDVCINVISESVVQCINYKIKVVEKAAESCGSAFPDVTIDGNDPAPTRGTPKVCGSEVPDVGGYASCAAGPHSGTTADDDPSAKGLADVGNSQRTNGKPITLKVAITDTESKSAAVVDAVFDNASSLKFDIVGGSDRVVDGNSPEVKISVTSGTVLTIELTDGAEVSVAYAGENPSVMTAKILSKTSADKQILGIHGNGEDMYISAEPGISDEKATDKVIGPSTSPNSIHVSCAPLPW